MTRDPLTRHSELNRYRRDEVKIVIAWLVAGCLGVAFLVWAAGMRGMI